WIAVGEPTGQPAGDGAGEGASEGASIGPERAAGSCGGAALTRGVGGDAPELLHLPAAWLYRAPLPRTKLTSPLPDARFRGTLSSPGSGEIELRDWRGMAGHNWGSEHAERWIWLHGIDFAEAPDAWLDVALGRILVAGRMTPWVANGALSVGGRRVRVGGLRARV